MQHDGRAPAWGSQGPLRRKGRCCWHRWGARRWGRGGCAAATTGRGETGGRAAHTKKLVKGLGQKPGLPFPAFFVLVFFACLRAPKVESGGPPGGGWQRSHPGSCMTGCPGLCDRQRAAGPRDGGPNAEGTSLGEHHVGNSVQGAPESWASSSGILCRARLFGCRTVPVRRTRWPPAAAVVHHGPHKRPHAAVMPALPVVMAGAHRNCLVPVAGACQCCSLTASASGRLRVSTDSTDIRLSLTRTTGA